jgi:hypothetical protein
MIIQTIRLPPSRAVWTETASNVSRLDPSGADQTDAENPTRNRKVVGSNPTSGSHRSRSAAWSDGFACFSGNRLATSCPRMRLPGEFRDRQASQELAGHRRHRPSPVAGPWPWPWPWPTFRLRRPTPTRPSSHAAALHRRCGCVESVRLWVRVNRPTTICPVMTLRSLRECCEEMRSVWGMIAVTLYGRSAAYRPGGRVKAQGSDSRGPYGKCP